MAAGKGAVGNPLGLSILISFMGFSKGHAMRLGIQLLVMSTVILVSGSGLAQAEDKKAQKWLDDAIEAWYENVEAVGDYLVEYEGKQVEIDEGQHFVTEFSGRTMRMDDKIRTERLVRPGRRYHQRVRAGILYDAKKTYIIEGFYDDSAVREVLPDDPEPIEYGGEVDPFRVGHGGINVTECDVSAFRGRKSQLHSMKVVNVFQVKLGVAAVFETDASSRMYRVIRFNRNLGWMPDLSELGVDVRTDHSSPPDGDDLQSYYLNRLIWKELKPKVYVPVFLETTSDEYHRTMQVAFEWMNHDQIKPEFFTTEHLQASHRLQDFAYAPRAVLRSSIPFEGLKVDWTPIQDEP